MPSPFELALNRKLVQSTFLREVVRPGRVVMDVAPFFLNSSFEDLEDGLTQIDRVDQQADSDFVCTTLAARARLDATQLFDPMPLIWVQVTDLSSGRAFFNEPLIMRTVFGDFGQPAKLAAPKVIPPNATLQVAVQPYDTRYDRAWLTFGGLRIYYERPNQ